MSDEPDTDAVSKTELAWWEWDVAANAVTCSPSKIRPLGYPLEEFVGVGFEAFTKLLHPEDHERTMQAMRDYLAGSVPLYQVDYRIRRVDGRYVWYVDRGVVVRRAPSGAPAVLRGLVFVLDTEQEEPDNDARFRSLRSALAIPRDGLRDENVPTVCMQCHRLKAAPRVWQQLEETVQSLIARPLSHGLCGPCAHELYPEIAQQLEREQPDLF